MRFRIVPFAPIGCSAAGIEITESDHAPAVRRGIPFQNLFEYELTLAIGIGGLFVMVFGDGSDMRRTIDSC